MAQHLTTWARFWIWDAQEPKFDETGKNDSRRIPHGFHTRVTFLACLEPEQARGNDVKCRWFAQLLLTASGGSSECGEWITFEMQVITVEITMQIRW